MRASPFERFAWTLPAFFVAIAVAVFVTAPREAEAVVTGPVTDDRALTIAAAHCIACHSTKPTNSNFARPPKGVVLETADELRRHATQIKQQAVLGRAMPLGNVTRMTRPGTGGAGCVDGGRGQVMACSDGWGLRDDSREGQFPLPAKPSSPPSATSPSTAHGWPSAPPPLRPFAVARGHGRRPSSVRSPAPRGSSRRPCCALIPISDERRSSRPTRHVSRAGAGLDSLTPGELARFEALNEGYRARFGFPFILAVKGADKQRILDAFEQRSGAPARRRSGPHWRR